MVTAVVVYTSRLRDTKVKSPQTIGTEHLEN